MKPNVIFFGNSQSMFSNRHFGALAESECTIAAVVDTPPAQRTSTNPSQTIDLPAFTEIARRRKIPAFEPANVNSRRFVRAVRDLSPDLFVAAGYVQILKPPLLAVPRIVAANFHASLLPAYRGKHPVFWALRNGERSAGLTVHVMEAGLDTGDILFQVRLRTRKRDSVATLYDRIMDGSLRLVRRLVDDAANGALHRKPQPRAGASYYSSTSEEDFRLDWSADAEQLRRWICTSPGKCFCNLSGQRVFFLDAEKERLPAVGQRTGTLLRIGRTNCIVATGRDALRLRRVRLEPERELFMAQLCREFNLREGDCLA